MEDFKQGSHTIRLWWLLFGGWIRSAKSESETRQDGVAIIQGKRVTRERAGQPTLHGSAGFQNYLHVRPTGPGNRPGLDRRETCQLPSRRMWKTEGKEHDKSMGRRKGGESGCKEAWERGEGIQEDFGVQSWGGEGEQEEGSVYVPSLVWELLRGPAPCVWDCGLVGADSG